MRSKVQSIDHPSYQRIIAEHSKGRQKAKIETHFKDDRSEAEIETYRRARELEMTLARDRTLVTIEPALMYERNLQTFTKKQGLVGKGKIGDTIIKDTSARDILSLVQKHFKENKQIRKGAKQMREIHAICRGGLLNEPEFADKYRKPVKAVRISRNNDSNLFPLSKVPSI